MVARTAGGREVAGSNPVIPTIFSKIRKNKNTYMNQQTIVIALVRRKEKVLLLRYGGDQGEASGKYELPGGNVVHGEQPEESLKRHLQELLGVSADTPYLSDVFTYTDVSHVELQFTVIAYEVVMSGEKDGITLGSKYNRYIWENPDEIDPDELTNQSHIIFSMYTEKLGKLVSYEQEPTEKDEGVPKEGIIIYSDGGSRGNPGPSAAGYVVFDSKKRLIYEGGAYLGITTNNLAEYHGVHLGLEKARELGFKYVEFRLDSLLVVNQLNGVYVIRNRELWPIHERIRDMLSNFDKVTFHHVKREFNQQADSMVNKILDTRVSK